MLINVLMQEEHLVCDGLNKIGSIDFFGQAFSLDIDISLFAKEQNSNGKKNMYRKMSPKDHRRSVP